MNVLFTIRFKFPSVARMSFATDLLLIFEETEPSMIIGAQGIKNTKIGNEVFIFPPDLNTW